MLREGTVDERDQSDDGEESCEDVSADSTGFRQIALPPLQSAYCTWHPVAACAELSPPDTVAPTTSPPRPSKHARYLTGLAVLRI